MTSVALPGREIGMKVGFRSLLVLGMVGFLSGRSATAPPQTPQQPQAHIYREIGGRKLHAFVFLPEDRNVPAPRAAVVLVHGGAWRFGSAEWTFAAARRFAGWGLVAVAVDYRLSVNGSTPVEALDDTRAAFRWVRERAADFRIDPKRVAGYGVSAGGQLVSVAALGRFPNEAPDGPSSGPDLLLLWSPAVFAPSDLLPPGVKASDHSPMDLAGPSAPPTCIINGDKDTVTPLPHAEQFRDRVVRAGGVCELHVYPGVGHLLTRDVANQLDKFDPDPKFTEDAYAQIERFLRERGFLPAR